MPAPRVSPVVRLIWVPEAPPELAEAIRKGPRL